MTAGAGTPGLSVPIERLQRRDPIREWNAVVPASMLAQGDVGLRVADVSVPESAEVSVAVVLDQVSEGVMVTGTVGCGWRGECARCLNVVDGAATAEVGELFEPRPTEGESYPLSDDHVDLTPMVRDAILLELPIAAIRCPHPEPCPHLPEELIARLDGGGDDGTDADSDGEDVGASAGRDLADPRWAALDQVRFDDD